VVTYEQLPEFFEWASGILNVNYRHGDSCKVVTNVIDNRIRGVVVYTSFTRRNCEMSMASDGSGHWITREFLRAAFGYPFLQMDLARVTGIVEHDNERALRLNMRLGFMIEGKLRGWFKDKDGIIFGMLANECRWIQ
jgi:RimJ/RimL family protein N-acetyltransferase